MNLLTLMRITQIRVKNKPNHKENIFKRESVNHFAIHISDPRPIRVPGLLMLEQTTDQITVRKFRITRVRCVSVVH